MKTEIAEKPLKTYHVSFNSGPYKNYGGQTIAAHSPAAARYQYWKYLDTGWPYKDYLNAFKVKCLGLLDHKHLFGNKEEFERMCQNRGITFAYQGMEVDVNGKKGIIVGNYGFNLHVLFPNRSAPANCHPTWKTTYYDDLGQVVKCFKEKKPES